jgi:hypothetical protein
MPWFSKRLKAKDKTWWYVSYSFVLEERLHCHAMVYTLTSQHFHLHSVERDLMKRQGTETLTILGWNRLTREEGEKIVAYFHARADALNAKLKGAGDEKPKHLHLVESTDGPVI